MGQKPKYAVGDTVYYENEPTPGRVIHVEDYVHPRAWNTFYYKVAFEGQPRDHWHGPWYVEGTLRSEPENEGMG